jgi:hypothetical protein
MTWWNLAHLLRFLCERDIDPDDLVVLVLEDEDFDEGDEPPDEHGDA